MSLIVRLAGSTPINEGVVGPEEWPDGLGLPGELVVSEEVSDSESWNVDLGEGETLYLRIEPIQGDDEFEVTVNRPSESAEFLFDNPSGYAQVYRQKIGGRRRNSRAYSPIAIQSTAIGREVVR